MKSLKILIFLKLALKLLPCLPSHLDPPSLFLQEYSPMVAVVYSSTLTQLSDQVDCNDTAAVALLLLLRIARSSCSYI